MSLSYSLIMLTELKPEQVAQFLAREVPGLTQTHDVDLVGQAVTVGVGKEGKLGQDITEETFGFRPTLNVVFHVYPSEGYEEGKRLMGRATAAVLRDVPGDAVFIGGGEDVVLQRINGELTINEGYCDWITPELDAAGVGYEQRQLATPVM